MEILKKCQDEAGILRAELLACQSSQGANKDCVTDLAQCKKHSDDTDELLSQCLGSLSVVTVDDEKWYVDRLLVCTPPPTQTHI
jgi:hypothetical protein